MKYLLQLGLTHTQNFTNNVLILTNILITRNQKKKKFIISFHFYCKNLIWFFASLNLTTLNHWLIIILNKIFEFFIFFSFCFKNHHYRPPLSSLNSIKLDLWQLLIVGLIIKLMLLIMLEPISVTSFKNMKKVN